MSVDERGNEYDEYTNLSEYARNKSQLMVRNVLSAVEKKWITESCARTIIEQINEKSETWDALFDHYDQLWRDYAFLLKHKEYFFTLDRIEKGEAYKAQQTDPAMIAAAQRKIDKLANELEALTPKEEIA